MMLPRRDLYGARWHGYPAGNTLPRLDGATARLSLTATLGRLAWRQRHADGNGTIPPGLREQGLQSLDFRHVVHRDVGRIRVPDEIILVIGLGRVERRALRDFR